MLRYILRRILGAVPTLLAISAVIFLVVALSPGNPLGELANNPAITPEVRENLRRALGLDQPLPLRYLKWLGAVLQGNLGYSFTSRLPVSQLLAQRLPTTLSIIGVAYGLSVALAVPLGVAAALRRNTWLDRVISTLAFTGFSVPTFFSGLLLILVFSVRLGWLPFIYDDLLVVTDWASAGQQIKQSIMPVAVLVLFQTAVLLRFVRAAMLDEIPSGYVKTARAKGLRSRRVVGVHILRNALIPVVTLVALDIPTIFTGALVTEQVFRIPGIGALLIDSIYRGDTPVVMAIASLYALLVVIFNLIADVIYALIDPRVRYS